MPLNSRADQAWRLMVSITRPACFALSVLSMNPPDRWQITDADIPFKLASLWVLKIGTAVTLFGVLVFVAWFLIASFILNATLSRVLHTAHVAP